MESDDGEGNRLSWRGWGRGFNPVMTLDHGTRADPEFSAAVDKSWPFVCAKLSLALTHARSAKADAEEKLKKAQERIDRDAEYIRQMDAVIDDNRVAASCINPLEDLKRAVAKLKEDRDAARAELGLSSGEVYPPGWMRVVLMVSPQCELHAVGGQREGEPGTDQVYPGLKRIQSLLGDHMSLLRKFVEAARHELDGNGQNLNGLEVLVDRAERRFPVLKP